MKPEVRPFETAYMKGEQVVVPYRPLPPATEVDDGLRHPTAKEILQELGVKLRARWTANPSGFRCGDGPTKLKIQTYDWKI